MSKAPLIIGPHLSKISSHIRNFHLSFPHLITVTYYCKKNIKQNINHEVVSYLKYIEVMRLGSTL